MIKFDPTSIYNRAISRLQQDPNWKPIINESVISALIKSNAEINAETARYAEYLFKESKWNTAQNESSILAMANMLGYQPKRRVSATGKIYFSSDPTIHLVGKTYSASTFISNTDNCSYLTTYNKKIPVYTTDIIKDTKGRKYIPVNDASLDSTKTSFSVEVVQGERKSINIGIETIKQVYTKSNINSYLYIPFRISNCENATSIFSRKFFKLYVVDKNNAQTEYRIVDSLLLSDAIDNDVELYNDMYDNTLFYAKFNNSQYRGKVLDVSDNSSIDHIKVEYIESLGSEGNIDSLYENFIIETTEGVRLYGINTSYIGGGAEVEDINSIKENATKFYIENYSVGTKESYEKTILNTEFTIENLTIKPKKVIVYGGTYTDEEANISTPVTYISFTSDYLDDIATYENSDELYDRIESVLNYYLGRLKSPQDTIKFSVPTYIPISVGVNCSIDTSDKSESIETLQNRIQTYINSLWGPSSDYITFGNNFTTSNLEKEIMNNFSSVKSIDMELEAVHKVDWKSAEFVNSTESKGVKDSMLRTMRVPFNFSSVFLGNKTKKGFKDIRVGASYILRMDILYKKPSVLQGGNLNKTIIVGNYNTDDTINISTEDSIAFYVVQDSSDIWGSNSGTGGATYFEGDYDILNSAMSLNSDVHQINYTSKVYSDSDYDTLRQQINSGKIATQSFATSLGALDSYIIYFGGNYQENSVFIGDGWIELSLDSLYTTLQYFASCSANSTMSSTLARCPLSVLKCGTLESTSDVFSAFKDLLTNYVDIYISMRPIDNSLKLIAPNLTDRVKSNNQKSIIYIDSEDSDISSEIENLTAVKYDRMICVACEYEES